MTGAQIPPNNPISVAPTGDGFSLPSRADFEQKLERPNNLVEEERRLGREIVVVMGVGFVGTVMGAVIADAVDRATGKPLQIVIGRRRPSSRSDWKIPLLNRGVYPRC